MAKLGSYYGLCPLIDQKSLLGVNEDVTPGCVIVTLGKNMAIKYKLSNQKQLHSWSTKEKLSSPVIYYKKESKYVAVFNQYYMRFWDEDKQNLEKLKKLKFTLAIHTIIPTDNEPIVIFKNGQVLTLSHALEIRKTLQQTDIIDKDAVITNQTYLKVDEKYFVGMLVKSNNIFTYFWIMPETKSEQNNNSKTVKIELSRPIVVLNGHLVMNTENGPVLFTLWSDGRFYMYHLNKIESEQETAIGTFYSVIESLSRQHSVCFLPLNETYIAMYGLDSNKEGASLQIYNIQFKVTQSKLSLKLFTEGTKLWLIGDSILLTVGQSLAVVPFHLATEQLAALVGSHKLTAASENEEVRIVTEMLTENWVDSPKNSEISTEIPKISVKGQLTNLMKEGWSESAICEEVIPKLLEKQDTEAILECLNYFTDISEKILVKILSYCLRGIINSVKNLEIIDKGVTGNFGSLLDRILTVAFNDILLLPEVRTGLKYDEIIILIQYFCFLLNTEHEYCLPSLNLTDSQRKIYEWGSIILDAYYQQFLLSKDSKTIDNINYFRALIETQIMYMEFYKNAQATIASVTRRKNKKNVINTDYLNYSIEKLQLY